MAAFLTDQDIPTPRDAQDVGEAIAWARAGERRLDVRGAGSRIALGRPMERTDTLDLSALSGVVDYEPAELVLTARPSTPLSEIEAVLGQARQHLAFEPMDHGPVLGTTKGRGTLGGMIGVNASGPRRIKAGGCRDHLLGFEAVSGRGEGFKAGGKVVKNVTGYDLSKLMAGAFGTLAVMTEVTLKVLPAPETTQTLVLHGLDDDAAVAAMSRALGSRADVSAAAHLPALRETLLRLEGFAPSVAARRDHLQALLAGESTVLGEDESLRRWRAIRDVEPLADAGPVIWRVSVPPMSGPALVRAVAANTGASAIYDWGGGLVWLAMTDAHPALIHAAAREHGGHARLVRAPAEMRAAATVLPLLSVAVAGLQERIKQAFDPDGVLNPGRLYPEKAG